MWYVFFCGGREKPIGGSGQRSARTPSLSRPPHAVSHDPSPCTTARTASSTTAPPNTYQQKQQALLSQMLIEGYGCAPDPEAAERWAARARRRGYRMQGVYCTI